MRVHSFSTHNKECDFLVKLSADETGSILEIAESIDYSDITITKQEDGVLFCIKIHSKDVGKQFNHSDFENDTEIGDASRIKIDEEVVFKNDTKPEGEKTSTILNTNKDSNYINSKDSMQMVDSKCDVQEPNGCIGAEMNQEKDDQRYLELIKEKEDLVIQRSELIGFFNQFREKMNEYQNNMPRVLYRGAFHDLALLHREMAAIVANGDMQESIYNRLIDVINSFGFKKIEPKRGDTLDLNKHALNDSNKIGEVVFRCLECGWEKGEETILKATVDVEEVGNGNE